MKKKAYQKTILKKMYNIVISKTVKNLNKINTPDLI